MKFVHSPQFWLGILVFVIGAAVLWAAALQRKKEAPIPAKEEPVENQGGFLDVVKNPDGWKEKLDESERALDQALHAAKTWDDRKVETEVRRFLFDVANRREAWLEARVLRSLGTRVQPTLLAILRDDKLRGKLVAPSETGILPESPFDRLCNLLAENPPSTCVPLLTPFLDDTSAAVRKEAALVIGCVGSEACVSPLRKALADSDEYVRAYALIGLQRAIKANRLDDGCRRDLFAAVKSLIGDRKNVGDAADILLQFNEQQAIEFLRSDQILTAEFSSLHEVLRVLSDRRVVVERARLLDIIRTLSPREMKYPVGYQLGEALRALGRHRAMEDRIALEKYLSHEDREVAPGASSGLLASHGLDDYQERIWTALKERGVGGLTEAQRHHYAVTIFNSEVNNGGLSQYFFNTSGDEWPAAVAGLEAMGSKERLAILRDAISKFGKGGPSTNRDERMVHLAILVKAEDEVFSNLDSRYYKSTEVIAVLTMRYVLGKPEAFR